MEIPELGEYVEESNEEENMSNFYDEILINHRKIFDEDEFGSYQFGFFINDMENIGVLHVVLSGNQLTREEKIRILLMRNYNNGNLLFHILDTIESEVPVEDLYEYKGYLEEIIRNILHIYPLSFITQKSNGDSPFLELVKGGKSRIFQNITHEVLLRFSEMNRINELLSLQDEEGDTLLHILLDERRNYLIRLILDRFDGDFLYIRNNDGDTPFLWACYKGYL